MKKFIDTLKNIWRVEELRKRILYTLGLILVYRIGSYVILPGVDFNALRQAADGQDNGLLALLNTFSGGAFNQASVMALGIMPYISASIIMQLLGMAVPAVQKMQSEGESGRKKINNYTRALTIAICGLQAPSYLGLWAIRGVENPTTFWWVSSVTILIAGCMFAMWLGERITDKGIGNGISLLITVGIIASLPGSFIGEVATQSSLIVMFLELLVFFSIVVVTVLIVQGVRRIPVQYAKRVVGGRQSVGEQQARSYIPLKVNSAGVMPIIFAQAIMTVPAFLQSYTESSFLAGFANFQSFQYNILMFLLIVIFTYFYTAIMINPKKMADDLKRNGGFIPGVKPGTDTSNFIDSLLSRITLPGSIFLGIIAILPAFAMQLGVQQQSFAYFFGGTSLLIMVGVVLDTLQQIESYLLNRHYDGLMEGGKVKGRRGVNEPTTTI